MKRFFLIVSICFAFFMLGGMVGAKIYVDISSPSFRPIPVAVCDFSYRSTGAAKPTDAGTAVSENIKKYLSLTGIFNMLHKKSFLEDTLSGTPVVFEKINFPNWRVIGADYLLQGNIVQHNTDLVADVHFYDVVRATPVLIKKYRAESGDLKRMAQTIASDIMMALINDRGEFNTHIAFVSKNGLQSDIRLVSYDGEETTLLTNHRSILLSPRWSPDGSLLAFTSFKRGRPEVYIRHLKTGEEKRAASFDGLNLCGGFSPDGKTLLLTLSKDSNEEIYALDVSSLQLRRLTNNYSIDVSPSFSPDGRKIVFVSNRSGSPQVYTMDRDGSNVRRITYDGNYNTSPSWSPRGDRIVYEGRINRQYQIFSIDAEGNYPQQLTFDNADNESPSWSPSGRQIVYVSSRGGKSRIMMINADGSQPRVLYDQNNKLAMPSWSPRLK